MKLRLEALPTPFGVQLRFVCAEPIGDHLCLADVEFGPDGGIRCANVRVEAEDHFDNNAPDWLPVLTVRT